MASHGKTLAVVNARPSNGARVEGDNSNINRSDFPEGFIFGTGTSSYQVEGAAFTGGKGLSIWDDFTLRNPARIEDGKNGNVACDMYHRYKEDARIMKTLGFDAYRFSISWPRILPGGRTSAGINREGIDYYNDLIDTLLANGLKPYVTLFHWDIPLVLEREYDGFLSRKVVPDFVEYVEVCFFEFGDRVKWWTTINEPWTYAVNGYVNGAFTPSRMATTDVPALRRLFPYRSLPIPDMPLTVARQHTEGGRYDRANPNPATFGYTVARNLLLAHSAAVNVYRTKFQPHQKGEIGIVLCSHWFVPYDPDSEYDQAAALRAVDFMLGWFLEPILYGRYPQTMIDFVPPESLAPFTQSEIILLKGSVDFVGFNYYTSEYIEHDHNPDPAAEGYEADMRLIFHHSRNGVPIGDSTGSYWLFVVPWGIYEHLLHFKNNYPDLPPLYITENGYPDRNNFRLTAKEATVDPSRTKYHQDHLANILKAMNEVQIDIRGYFAWSYCDNFEWTEGYESRFGLVYIDFINNLTRYPKNSAMWFTKFLKWNKEQMPISAKRSTEEEAVNGSAKKTKAS